ncbi:MAG: putative bifunctional diguanylate cyclase/phosphodiesterase, partial [Acidimicrobiales bacterium]
GREQVRSELFLLGNALASRPAEVAETLLETMHRTRREPAVLEPQKQDTVRRLGTEASAALASYLVSGDPPEADQVEQWTKQSSAPFHGVLELAELVKLTLGWRDAVVQVILKEAERLGTSSCALEEATNAAQIGCDSTLVSMARHFDIELRRIRHELGAEHARSAHQDFHDSLTGLANRSLLLDRLAHALDSSLRRKTSVAVLFVDLDQFKEVNNVAGHRAGDAVLAEVARRLEAIVRPSDTVARLGSDEFVVLCEDIGSPQVETTAVAKRMLTAMSAPFAVADREVFNSASVGIAVGRPGDDPEDLIARADAAMYLAKQRGRGRYELYELAIEEGRTRRAELANALHRALDRDELVIVYQPVKKIESRAVVTMEALLRWHHPVLGQVSPAEFIPIAEETGLIVEIGRWVLETACSDCRAWQEAGHEIGVSINLSGRQLTEPSLVGDVGRVLGHTGLPPASVTFELTESILVTTDGCSRAVLEQLKALGVRLAIDDFGTGYSSLSYLAELPVDDLKIDRSFVARLGNDDQSLPMVGAVVELAHTLGLSVVAEGVETKAELEELIRVGCDEAQGYLLGRPHPLSASDQFADAV